MPIPTVITDLSTTAASNFPAGSDSPANLDDVQRAHGAFIAQLRDDPLANLATPVAIAKGGTGAATAAAARTALGAATAGALASSGITGAAASGANSDITSLTALTAGGLPNNSVLTADIADAQITPAKLSQPLTAGTAVATTSGTSHDFTSIPSWVSRMVVSGSGVSTNGTSPLQIQIGSGSVSVSGYTSQSWSASAAGGIVTSGFYFTGSAAAANAYTFVVTLVRLSGNQWIASGIINIDNASNVGYQIIGKITLGGTLDRLRLTTVSGTDTFDAGSVNILYE